jgi:TnpA family transposase
VFYKITELKFDPKCFKKQEMSIEIDKLETCILIFNFSKTFLPKTKISRQNIEYYADLAKLYTVDRLLKISVGLSSFYLICYVNQRCGRIIDNLIKGFIYYVDKYNANAEQYAKENLLEFQSDLEKHTESIGHLIELYTDDELMKLSGKKIRKEAFKIMPKENILKLSECLLNSTATRNELKTKLIWEYHKENYRLILNNLRPLFLAIDFASEPELNSLLEAIAFLKNHLASNKNLHNLTLDNCPIQHIGSKKLMEYFVEPKSHGKKKKKINIYQYEFYIYKLIRENFRKHRIFVNDSIEHKSFAVDIKKHPNWGKNKTKILKQLNNKVLLTPIDNILLELEELLESSIAKTNKNIANGENKHIKIKKCKNGEIEWTLPYPKKNDELDNPFYDNLEQNNISDVYDFVEQECGFNKAFKHFKPKYAKSKLDYLAVKGVVLANATTQGSYQFSKRSNIKYQRLRIAEKNYVRLENLRGAASIIIDKLEKLPIFDIYNLSGKRHGSIDGTKKKTRRRTMKARYSPKYFGLDVGIVIMTMTLNNVPFISKIIGANEHESHFSYPMLFNNNTAIDPHIISTDTAGTNNVNDFLFFLIGKTHAACYRSIVDKTKTICGFKPLSHYSEFMIKPTKVANKNLIKKNWSELLPILVALLSHETDQQIIIKKLSSHDYKNEVKEALWELNNILKSVHILKYIDDPNYMRDIRTALNRGEAGNQIINKVMSVGNGDFRGMTDLEVEIWNECNRLIILVILYYNASILSKLYEIKKAAGDNDAIEILRHISFAATQHINLDGLYSFSETMGNIDINNVVSILNKILDDTVKSKK